MMLCGCIGYHAKSTAAFDPRAAPWMYTFYQTLQAHQSAKNPVTDRYHSLVVAIDSKNGAVTVHLLDRHREFQFPRGESPKAAALAVLHAVGSS